MTLNDLKQQLDTNPEAINFTDVMHIIDTLYTYTPTTFENGLHENVVINEAGTNEGSCKLFAFAKDQHFDEQQTLYCFGKYYTEDVLKHPEGNDHNNIRHFIKYGWEGIRFTQTPLIRKD